MLSTVGKDGSFQVTAKASGMCSSKHKSSKNNAAKSRSIAILPSALSIVSIFFMLLSVCIRFDGSNVKEIFDTHKNYIDLFY